MKPGGKTMKRISLTLFAMVIAFSFVAAQSAVAHEVKLGVKKLVTTPLGGMPGKEAKVVRLDVGPGWKVGHHTHPGHVFVYVISGSVQIDVDGKPAAVVKQGELWHEVPNKGMVAKNMSSTKGMSVLIFSVGDSGQPMTVMSKK